MIIATNVFSMETLEKLPLPSRLTSAPFAMTTFTAIASTYWEKKDAIEILNDSQEYMQSGSMPLALDQKIKIVQKETEVSDNEALDLLIEFANKKLAE